MISGARIATALREWLQRVGAIVVPRRDDRDLEQELELHLEMAAEEARRRGESPDRARRMAAIHAGGVAQTMEALRDQRGLPWLDDLVRDVRHAFRLLRRSPVFAAVAIVSLALGIGANAAIFSLADASLLRPLPVRDPDRIVTIAAASPDDRRNAVSYLNYRDLRALSASFDGVVAHQRTTFSFARSPRAAAEMRMGVLVSDNFFTVLGIPTAWGRTFTPDEGAVAGRDAVVVLAYDFWKNALAEDRSILSQIVRINGIDFTVVGITAETFTGLDPYIRPAFYIPLMMAGALSGESANVLDDRGARTLVVKARLKDGTSRRAAQAELSTIWQRLEELHPAVNRSRTLAVRSELESRMQSDPTTAIAMTMLMALVAIVLIIACANVANLMLSRARARCREMAIRLALGVSRTRLLRQLLTESLVLAIIGALVGLGFAYGTIRVFRTFQTPTDLPVEIVPQLDRRVLLFSLLTVCVTAMLCGLAPAWQSLKTRLVPALKCAEAAESARQGTIGRHMLVVAQIALSMTLLVASAILLDAFFKLAALNPGFRTDRLMMMSVDTSFVRYTPVQTRAFYRRLKERVQSLPGVASVALTSAIPLDRGGFIETVIPDGYRLPQGHDNVPLFTAVVDDDYFATMKTEIVRGRAFTDGDTAGTHPVAIVNEECARTYWPGQDPIGRHVRLTDSRGAWLDVVGVAKTGKYLFIGEAPMRFLYLPFAQHERTQMSLLVESTTVDAASLAAPLREVVRDLDPNQPVFNVRSFSTFYEQRAIAVPLALARMVATMGLLGLTLALVGLYGVVAYSVAQRTREIGIRMAIGADRFDVLKMILRQGFVLSMVAIGVGSAASVAVARLLAGVMPGVGAPHPVTYVVVPLMLMGLTMAASYFPARSASLVDPLVALRDE
jgi:macrolide transport system ATP-binding/permease protein